MKVKLIIEEIITVAVPEAVADKSDPRRVGQMRVDSEWHGFRRLVNERGDWLIVTRISGSHLSDELARSFGSTFGFVVGDSEWLVLNGSPRLLKLLEQTGL